MKKILAVFMALCMMFTFGGCRSRFDVQKAVNLYDHVLEQFGRFMLTRDGKLIGEREFADDRYTGTYSANCDGADRKEVVFGGTSVKERKIKLTAFVFTESGAAVIRVRMGERSKVLNVDENGCFEKELVLNGGGNYIMIDYDDFTGIVVLYSEYIE